MVGRLFFVLINFNPRSPRGERLKHGKVLSSKNISIHAPRVGSDDTVKLTCEDLLTFQSTLPAWGATRVSGIGSSATTNFNPRSPRGERLLFEMPTEHERHFNPRSPRGERLMHYVTKLTWSDFNPRSPRGERRGAPFRQARS